MSKLFHTLLSINFNENARGLSLISDIGQIYFTPLLVVCSFGEMVIGNNTNK